MSVGTSLTEIELAEGAELVRVQLRRHGEDAAHVGHTAVSGWQCHLYEH